MPKATPSYSGNSLIFSAALSAHILQTAKWCCAVLRCAVFAVVCYVMLCLLAVLFCVRCGTLYVDGLQYYYFYFVLEWDHTFHSVLLPIVHIMHSTRLSSVVPLELQD